jgi:hypothetical protein
MTQILSLVFALFAAARLRHPLRGKDSSGLSGRWRRHALDNGAPLMSVMARLVDFAQRRQWASIAVRPYQALAKRFAEAPVQLGE